MQWQDQNDALWENVSSLLLIPSSPEIIPVLLTKDKFESLNEEWFEKYSEILNDGCEFVISVCDDKMHAGNFRGVYRFSYNVVDGNCEIKLLTPVDIYTLTEQHFIGFLHSIYHFFPET